MSIILGCAILSACVSFIFFIRNKTIYAAIFLSISAFLIRYHFIQLDPFLNDWDERYHALVSKNMIKEPLTPMLRVNPVLQYDYKAWTGNHIWVHKQPLFLWQMALSMKIFGVNEIAMRLPSAVLSALLILIIVRIGVILGKITAGYSAAFLFTFSWFQIEQVTGHMGMDHNDVAFTFYVTLSLWSYLEYIHSGKKYWIICIGLFTGLGILVKWLTILVVYGCWGLSILFRDHFKIKLINYLPLFYALVICCAVFLPWQIYIIKKFPLEAAYSYQFNQRHITEAIEGHTGNNFYYFTLLKDQYSSLAIPLLIMGIFLLMKYKTKIEYKITILLSVLTIYIFFSFIVETKAPNYVYIISPFILLLIGLCIEAFINIHSISRKPYLRIIIQLLVISFCAYLFFSHKTLSGIHNRGISKFTIVDREKKIHNTAIFKKLDSILVTPHVVFNVNGMEETEAMFYSNQNVYNWYPPEKTIDSLKNLGYKIAAFTDHGNQILPDYIKKDTSIFIIPYTLK